MTTFFFRAVASDGKVRTGRLAGETDKFVARELRNQGLTPVYVGAEAKKSYELKLPAFATGRRRDVLFFTQEMSTLLNAGVPLDRALAITAELTERPSFRAIVLDVLRVLKGGKPLADSLATHGEYFSDLFVNMVRAGEASGALDAVLARLADFTEGQAKMKQKLIGTLIYPAIMTVIGGGILTMLMTVVVPKVTRIFETMQATLPWTTRVLIFASNLLSGWWWLIIPVVVGSVVGSVAWTRSANGRPVFDAWVLKVPVVGALLRMLLVSRFSRTLATLLKAGVPMLTAMDITKNVVTNTVLAGVVEMAREAIREGESIAGPLKRSGQFPPLVYHMIAVGERSGQLEEMLLNVADSYENQVNVRLGALTALLEPLIIVAMGAIIAFVAFSILMPILQLNTTIR